MRILKLVLILPGLFVAWFLFWPAPVEFANWQPQPDPANTSPYIQKNQLARTKFISTGEAGHGPEAIEIGADGYIYTGLENGKIMRYGETGKAHMLADTQGRPLGMEFDQQGNLIIADADKGLLSLSPDGTLTNLLTEIDGTAIRFADDLAVSETGIIWLSDATQLTDYHTNALELMASYPSGRLIKYDPKTATAKIALSDLAFANGVALAANESYVLVNETMRYRVIRLWLTGEKAGQSDIFIDNLPGFPDNITETADGGFWVSLVSARDDGLDRLMSRPFLRKLIWRGLDLFGTSFAPSYVWAVKLDKNGEIEQVLHGEKGSLDRMTSVVEYDSKLYLGMLQAPHFGVYQLD